jgi:hypothetical protein
MDDESDEPIIVVLDKGKPIVRWGRKAMGSYRPRGDG